MYRDGLLCAWLFGWVAACSSGCAVTVPAAMDRRALMMCILYGADVVCFPSFAQCSTLGGGVLAILILSALAGRGGDS